MEVLRWIGFVVASALAVLLLYVFVVYALALLAVVGKGAEWLAVRLSKPLEWFDS